MNKYEIELEVPYFACNKNGNMTPLSILEYLGEASSAHSDSLGLGFNELNKDNYGWVLNRWKVKFIKYPRVKDRIIIKTWTSMVYKFYANREFIIYDSSGDEMIRASTVWVFLNTTRKRPIKIPEDIVEKYNMFPQRVFEDFYKFNGRIKNDKFKKFSTRKSDIDYNNHVNNVKYLDWMLELIPEEIDEDYLLEELEIQYKKEIRHKDIIVSIRDKGLWEDECLRILHNIHIENNNDINTFGRTLWRKKP